MATHRGVSKPSGVVIIATQEFDKNDKHYVGGDVVEGWDDKILESAFARGLVEMKEVETEVEGGKEWQESQQKIVES